MNDDASTILVVEDDSATRTFLADNLSADGYELLVADCASIGLSLLERKFPDLALVDIGLPDGSGFELLRRVRSADGITSAINPDTPLMVVSGRATELDRVRGFDRGADDYVAKPFSYPELRGRIAALLRRVRSADGVSSRMNPDTPLMVLSGRATELDRVRGFDRGADDYLCKPFSYPELRGRIAALLRRSNRRPSTGRLRAGQLEVDPPSREVRLRGERMALSQKEFALLRTLASEPTRVFTKEELLRTIWGYRAIGSTRTLDSHACRLRHKLGVFGDRYIVNVWGVGYRLVDTPALALARAERLIA